MLTLVVWFVPEYLGSGSLLRAAERALQPNPDSAAFAASPFLEVFRRSASVLSAPVYAGALIGVVSVAREHGVKLRHKALLSRMFIHPDAAGLGLGKLMLHETIMLAVSVPDRRQIYLTVLETNEPAQRLYAAAGFRSYSHEPDAVKIGDAYVAELQMVRILRRDTRG